MRLPSILLQMAASGRGVTALPRWLVQEYGDKMDVVPVRLGPQGIAKQIFVGARAADLQTDYLQAFIALAREPAQHVSTRAPQDGER